MDHWWNRGTWPIQLRTLTEPGAEPVTYEEMADHLHLTEDSEASHVDAVRKAARVHLEATTGRRFIKQRVRQTLDAFPPGGRLPLAASPLLSTALLSTGATAVVVRYYTDGSTGTVWSSTNYHVARDLDPPALVVRRNLSFPTAELRAAGGVEVDYWVGYSTGPETAPEWARMAIQLTGGHWFLNRESVVTGTIATRVPDSADALVAPHRSPLTRA